MSFKTRFRNWEQGQTLVECERNRSAFLRSAPLPQNDPALTRPVKVKVLKPTFCIKGKLVEADSVITMPHCDVVSLQAAGKVEIVKEL